MAPVAYKGAGTFSAAATFLAMRASMLGLLAALTLVTDAIPAAPGQPQGARNAAEALPEAPRPTKRTAPRFPYGALNKEIAGDAVVTLSITPDGEPVDVVILEETPAGYGFGKAAIESVGQWRFAAGQPGQYKLTVKFRIENALRVLLDGPVTPAPVQTKRTAAVYPPLAFRAGIEGTVTILVELENGEVDGVGVGYHDPKFTDEVAALFGDAASRAVLNWKFQQTANGLFAVDVTFSAAELAAGRLVKHRIDR